MLARWRRCRKVRRTNDAQVVEQGGDGLVLEEEKAPKSQIGARNSSETWHPTISYASLRNESRVLTMSGLCIRTSFAECTDTRMEESVGVMSVIVSVSAGLTFNNPKTMVDAAYGQSKGM